MPTAKKRINLSVDERLWRELQAIKRKRGAASLASLVVELTKEALETQEDLYFAGEAERRRDEPAVSHEKFWEDL